MKRTATSLLLLIISFCFFCAASLSAQENSSASQPQPSDYAPASSPEFLSHDELVKLSATAQPEGTLATHLNTLLNTPFVSNDASSVGTQPHRPTVEHLGPVLRVAFWNIERGLNFDLIRSALMNPTEFQRLAGTKSGITDAQKQAIETQLHSLQEADVVVMNEVDLGMKRTEYRDVARELATAMHMNYTYGVEFVEVDPVFELGIEQVHLADSQEDARLQKDLQVDPDRYRGLHGNAILSRYPIRNVRILRFPVCHDWYNAEAKQAAKIEQARRWTAEKLFRERIQREVRHGGRIALIAQLTVPDVPTGEVTVVAPHLENKCPPACRRKQMNTLLAELKDDKNPLVMAGDLNTTSKDNTPLSIKNEIMKRVADYKFWIGQVISKFNPIGIYQYALFPVQYFHGYMDPTSLHILFFWENHERALFKTVEKFRFVDDRAFDFRGQKDRSTGQRGRTLADSNQRASKGFVPTFAFAKDYGGLVGRFKLDWFFVKPFVQNPRGVQQSYRFAPHFGTTMRELNDSVEERISDHPPLTVDLPLQEPGPLR